MTDPTHPTIPSSVEAATVAESVTVARGSVEAMREAFEAGVRAAESEGFTGMSEAIAALTPSGATEQGEGE